ncbi:YagK/YfjJ domain-containing protein [Marinomonas sp.]|uniref:YagK/YfjJ domain-containing protein n=1 Tax=Marinomonas sp. TaxID=1904862 RepID=UPI003A8FA93C
MIKATRVELGGRSLELPMSKSNQGHFLPILAKIDDQVSAMLSHHCKVMVYRLDFRLYDYTSSNKVMSTFLKRYTQTLQRTSSINRVAYLWCREQHKADHQHYHAAFIVDGNKHQRPGLLINQARRYWDDRDIGTLSIPKQCYKILRRGDNEAYQQVFERLSYIAKVFSKGTRGNTINDYSTSRIKPKEVKLIA